MSRPRILVTRRVPAKVVERLRAAADVEHFDKGTAIPRPRLLRALKDKDGLLCMLTEKVDGALLAAAPGLKAVATFSVGYDHVDLAACRARGVAVTNTPDVLTETVADYAWALLLAAARRVVESDAFLRAGKYRGWDPLMLLGADVHGKTLGVVGFGRIGRAVARRARGFGMRVLYHDGKRAPQDVERELGAAQAPLERLLAESDFVTVHASLQPGSVHLIGAPELERMKPGAYLVNTARGPVLDERALTRALKAGRLAGAALDVYEKEPRLAPGLASCRNAVLTPHVASATAETREKMGLMAAEGLLDSLAGRASPWRVDVRGSGSGSAGSPPPPPRA